MNYLSKRFKDAMVDRARARDTKRREQEVKRQPSPMPPFKIGENWNDVSPQNAPKVSAIIDNIKLFYKYYTPSELLLTSDRLTQKSSIELSSEKIWKA